MSFVVIKGSIKTDDTGAATEMPVILTQEGPLMTLVDYCISKDRSIAWMRKMVKALMLFLQYVEAQTVFPEERWRIFSNFARALRKGTFNLDLDHGPIGIDPSGLCWTPGGAEVDYYISLLSDFLNWISEKQSSSNKFNPTYRGGKYDQFIDQKAYLYRRSAAFLGHTWRESATSDIKSHVTRPRRSPKISRGNPPEFPDDRFEEFLFRGFRVNGKYDYRGMAITLLMHGAGFRVSEPFHMYMSDVRPHWNDRSTAFVTIHHPSLGLAPSGWVNEKGVEKRGNRVQYLAQKWAMSPRDEIYGRQGSGWKNPMLDDAYYMQAWWFDPVYGQWFLQIWNEYVKEVVDIDRDNPFAFVNLHRSPKGGMYCLDTFSASHKAAAARIDLPYGKEYGTTEHGHRHSYAQRLKRAGINGKLLQKLLHHCSVDSQQTYIEPTTRETHEAIARATEIMRTNSKAKIQSDLNVILNRS